MTKLIIFLLTLMLFVSSMAQNDKQFRVFFSPTSYDLDLKAQAVLDSIIELYKNADHNLVIIEGHTDSIGSMDENQQLSIKRTNAVGTYLKTHSFNCDSMVFIASGENKPLYWENNFGLNRRVEISIISTDPIHNRDNSLEQQISNAAVGERIELRNIGFVGGTPVPLPQAKAEMDELLLVMQQHPTLVISIEGHICCANEDVEDLSGQRAKAVYDYLLANGIDASRMSYKGFGHTRPLTMERTEEEMQANRRVEIRIVSK